MKNHQKLHELRPTSRTLDAKRHWIWNIWSHSSDNNSGQWISRKDRSFNISHAYFTAGCYLNECTLLRALWTVARGGEKGENRSGNRLSRGGTQGRLRFFPRMFFLFSHSRIGIFLSHTTFPSPSWWIFDSIPRRWRWQKENRNLAQTKININHKWISSKRWLGKTRELYFLTARCSVNPIHYLFIDSSLQQ